MVGRGGYDGLGPLAIWGFGEEWGVNVDDEESFVEY
jgi:hypothetical protein